MIINDKKELVFNEENWFEIYYRLGFTWDDMDREQGAPDSLTVTVNSVTETFPRGTKFTFQGVTLLGVSRPVQSVRIGNCLYKLEPILFTDTRTHDIIVHIADLPGEKSQLWMGKVIEVGDFQAWGMSRLYAVKDDNGIYRQSGPIYADPLDVHLASPWHATEPGHSLYRVTERINPAASYEYDD